MKPLTHKPIGPQPTITTVHHLTDTGSFLPYAIAITVISVLLAGMLVYRLSTLNQQNRQISEALAQRQTQYDSLKDVAAKVTEIDGLAQALKAAYGAQVPFDEVVGLIEKRSYKIATYDSISIDEKGVVKLNGLVNTYLDFAKLVKAFKGEETDGTSLSPLVDMGGVTQSLRSVEGGENGAEEIKTKFDITFELRPELFKKPSTFGQVTPANTL